MTETDPLTLKQARWLEHKVQQQMDRKQTRGVAVTITEVRVKTRCTCNHTAKHHTKTGHCRPGCDCTARLR